ncbi:MAG: glycosyltransferase [Candidatus Poribacteria bacterium]|nr:glycosyltransferase [Candidatus Poribacteria bacterium]MDE0505406.1 glycosyltransferase [Candidatus Poribacteria bacterium]
MRIVLSTWGTTGDVHPFVALSERLVAAGHDVRVCVSSLYKDRFAKFGVDFYAVGVPFNIDQFHGFMDDLVRIKNPLESAIRIVKDGILADAEEWYQDCLRGMEGYDLAICHSADVPGQEAAIKNKLPWLTVSYCPGFIKTAEDAPYPAPNLGPQFNCLSWRVAEWLIRKRADPAFNEFIASVGGQERKLIGVEGMYSPQLNLVAASQHICPPPSDLPKHHRFTGAWFLDEPNFKVPTALQDFLRRGEPPVIISFGSMGGTRAAETTRILIEAVELCGQRAVIQAGWGNLQLPISSQSIYFVEYVPHNLLFRQGKCVVHHGGAGTTASVCRAGVPSVVIPHLGDQPYWGRRLRRLGVALRPLYRCDMTAESLARRIRKTISSKSMAKKARALGEKISTEDGLGTAIELIGSYAGKKGGLI